MQYLLIIKGESRHSSKGEQIMTISLVQETRYDDE